MGKEGILNKEEAYSCKLSYSSKNRLDLFLYSGWSEMSLKVFTFFKLNLFTMGVVGAVFVASSILILLIDTCLDSNFDSSIIECDY